jgi:hypothetical protein
MYCHSEGVLRTVTRKKIENPIKILKRTVAEKVNLRNYFSFRPHPLPPDCPLSSYSHNSICQAGLSYDPWEERGRIFFILPLYLLKKKFQTV